MLRVRQSDLCFPLAFIAAGVLLFQAMPTQWHLGESLSFVNTRIGYSDFARPHHRPFRSDIESGLSHENRTSVEFLYIRFDRKQNTRLWPFIFTGITRSPPASR
jgi:hypothetical protein